MSAANIERLTAALAKMRRPEIHLHPEDAEGMPAVGVVTHGLFAGFMPAASIPVVSDASVEAGHVWIVDREAPSVEWKTPTSLEPAVLDRMDAFRTEIGVAFDRYMMLGIDLGHGADSAVIATILDGKVIDVQPLTRTARRPWRTTGRQRTRARWSRSGRR